MVPIAMVPINLFLIPPIQAMMRHVLWYQPERVVMSALTTPSMQ